MGITEEVEDFDFISFEQWLSRWSGQRVNGEWFIGKMHKTWCTDNECIHREVINIAFELGLIEEEIEKDDVKLVPRVWAIIK